MVIISNMSAPTPPSPQQEQQRRERIRAQRFASVTGLPRRNPFRHSSLAEILLYILLVPAIILLITWLLA